MSDFVTSVQIPDYDPTGFVHKALEVAIAKNEVVVPPGTVDANGDPMTQRQAFELKMLQNNFRFSLTGSDNFTGLVQIIPPHTVSGRYGPHRSDVLVVGKMPNQEDADWGRNFGGFAGQVWKTPLDRANVSYNDWVVTNIVWFPIPFRYKYGKFFTREFRRYLAMTYHAVRPKFVLTMGADALKDFWSIKDEKVGAKMALKDARGGVLEFEPGVKLVAIPHPMAVEKDPYEIHEIERGLQIFTQCLRGQQPDSLKTCEEEEILEIDNLADLTRLTERLIAENRTRFAIDCEWGDGDYREGKLRTIQLSWARGKGAVIILRRQGLKPAFNPSLFSAIEGLTRLLKRPGVTIVGHNARGDLKWTREYGLDLTEEFVNGGFDTMLGAHLLDEAGELQLELVAGRFVMTPRYDRPLRDWLTANKVDKKQIEVDGYGYVPDEILHPYAVRDAIVTLMLDEVLVPKLQAIPELWHLYTTGSHRVHLALDEMEMTGIYADEPRLREQANLFKEKQAQILAELRAPVEQGGWGWAEFNPRSVYHVREILFDFPMMKAGVPVWKAPETAVKFHLEPVKATDDTPWEKVKQSKFRDTFSPSTDSESLGILAAEQPRLEKLRTFKVIDQIMKNFLRPEELDDEGEWEWTGGLGKVVDPKDSRIRVRYFQSLETGRYSTRVNVQNIPKRQEKEIQKAFQLKE